MQFSLDWPRSNGLPQSTALFKHLPEDFQVHEFFSAPFSGEGEHLLLHIEKKGVTTEEVVKSLARLVNKPAKLISYAGLKDRQSLATQWIGIHAPGEVIEGIMELQGPGWRVLETTRHHKKLKPGFLSGNRFIIRLRKVTCMEDLTARLERLETMGVPNYFGEQRFGRGCGNLFKAEELLVAKRKIKDRFLKGMVFSAARSWLYNLVLAERVKEGSWNVPLSGDVMQLSGSHSIFIIDEVDPGLLQRVREKDVAPASPLPGKSTVLINDSLKLRLEKIYQDWPCWIKGLEQLGLEQAWRTHCLHLGDLSYETQNKDQEVLISFTLPPGGYATAVMRELAQI